MIGLQNQLNIFMQASNRIGLTVNLEKEKRKKRVMVWRKMGHLARHERWLINGYRYQLKEADFSTYLGYTFTAKVSNNKGLELITVRGK